MKKREDKEAYKEERRRIREKRAKLYPVIGFAVALALVMTLFFGFILPKTEKLHYHVWLSIVKDGQEIPIPKDVGIETNPDYFKWHGLDQYSSAGGQSAIHTHDAGGPFHIESTVVREYTLGELLMVGGWDFGNASSIELQRINSDDAGQESRTTIADTSSYKDHVFEDNERLVLIVKTS